MTLKEIETAIEETTPGSAEWVELTQLLAEVVIQTFDPDTMEHGLAKTILFPEDDDATVSFRPIPA